MINSPTESSVWAVKTTLSRQVRDLELHRRHKPDAFDQSDSGVALRTKTSLKIKIGLRALLLGLQQLRFGGKPVIEPRLRRLLHRFCRVQRALSYHHLLPRRAELVKPVRHIKDDFLVRSVEADIRHHQFLPCCCPGRVAFTEVDQQPLCVQLGPRQQRFSD